jgi:hypothetical protein
MNHFSRKKLVTFQKGNKLAGKNENPDREAGQNLGSEQNLTNASVIITGHEPTENCRELRH